MARTLSAKSLAFRISLFKGEGKSDKEVLEILISTIEKNAKEILSDNGYGVREEYLNGDDEHDREAWVSEALHLMDYDMPKHLKVCASTICEAYRAREFLKKKAKNKVELALSIANLTARALVPSDFQSEALYEAYKNEIKRSKDEPLGKKLKSLSISKNNLIKQAIRNEARQLIHRGKLRHNKIADAIMDKGIHKNESKPEGFAKKTVLELVKEECKALGRDDLIIGTTKTKG